MSPYLYETKRSDPLPPLSLHCKDRGFHPRFDAFPYKQDRERIRFWILCSRKSRVMFYIAVDPSKCEICLEHIHNISNITTLKSV